MKLLLLAMALLPAVASCASVCVAYLDASNTASVLNVETKEVTTGGSLPFPASFTWSAAFDPSAETVWGVGGGQSGSARHLVRVRVSGGDTLVTAEVGDGDNCPYALAPGPEGSLYALWQDTSACPSSLGGLCFVSVATNKTAVAHKPLAVAPSSSKDLGNYTSCFNLASGSTYSFSGFYSSQSGGSYTTLWSCGNPASTTRDLVFVTVNGLDDGGGGSSYSVTPVDGATPSGVVDFWPQPTDGMAWIRTRPASGLTAVSEVFFNGTVASPPLAWASSTDSRDTVVLLPVQDGFCTAVLPVSPAGAPARFDCAFGEQCDERFLSQTISGFGDSSTPYNSLQVPMPVAC